MALETFAQLEAELRARIGDRNVDHLRSALETEWGEPPPTGASPELAP